MSKHRTTNLNQSGLTNASALHRTVYALVRKIFPHYTLLENKPIKVSLSGRDQTLYVDIVIKELNVAIECHGRQHFDFVGHFHGTRSKFSQAVERDQAKALALHHAGYAYVMVPHTQQDSLNESDLMSMIFEALQNKDRLL
jgi:hypothetical protein